VTETFGGRKTKKELSELKNEHHDLEERFDDLQDKHEKLQHEAGEQTNMRISHIEEEIEAMNHRVEKLANDSYEIRGEVRDIHESVMGMQTSLSEIVKLYKAIITQYGFGDIKAAAAKPVASRPRPGEEPGDAIIRALKNEGGGVAKEPSGSTAAARTPPPPPRPAPSSSNALDELHRLSEAHRDRETDRSGGKETRVVARTRSGDKVDRVARRDLDRPGSSEMDRDGEFTRSLPKKDLKVQTPESSIEARPGDGWESMHPPKEQEGNQRRPKPKLEDLLSPE
jgi:archaellum component FlaC